MAMTEPGLWRSSTWAITMVEGRLSQTAAPAGSPEGLQFCGLTASVARSVPKPATQLVATQIGSQCFSAIRIDVSASTSIPSHPPQLSCRCYTMDSLQRHARPASSPDSWHPYPHPNCSPSAFFSPSHLLLSLPPWGLYKQKFLLPESSSCPSSPKLTLSLRT